MRAASSNVSGFSLVEIALALGIVSVALISLLSLLGAGTNSHRSATRDTTLVAMTQIVMNDLRAANFDALWKADPRAAGAVPPVAKGEVPQPTSYFFTIDGTPVAGAEAASSLETVYECTVTKTPDAATCTASDGTCNLLLLELTFSSPVTASVEAAKRPNRQTIHASIARY